MKTFRRMYLFRINDYLTWKSIQTTVFLFEIGVRFIARKTKFSSKKTRTHWSAVDGARTGSGIAGGLSTPTIYSKIIALSNTPANNKRRIIRISNSSVYMWAKIKNVNDLFCFCWKRSFLHSPRTDWDWVKLIVGTFVFKSKSPPTFIFQTRWLFVDTVFYRIVNINPVWHF